MTNRKLHRTVSPSHRDAIEESARRLAPELAAWSGGDIRDVELEMSIDEVAALGFGPSDEDRAANAACEEAQGIFCSAVASALRNLWSSLSDEAREHLLECEGRVGELTFTRE